ncbi:MULTISPECIES: hypothetical protein [Streptomyces]|uniref:hypothetical protein n=1 Tax=Streptomyces lycopersici TaxID=2974589 RepID=UPI0021CF9920|nr:hypothetical protein [Streptomyces sp. NEAU-383]
MAITTPCPSCRRPKGRGKYLCGACWFTLPQPARSALNRRDDHAMARLRELHSQLTGGVPLHEIQVTR